MAKLLIGGEQVNSVGKETTEVRNPATGEVVDSVPKGTSRDVEQAIGAKNLAESEKFYIQVLGARVVRRIEPTQEQFDRGRVKEVDVQLG
ncbi:MAG: hypothetical protein O6948_12070, partial [Deltaproteobacteria bacterium]|nr:hypothetical protein [Deltaproteobacteria bacterium]